MDNLVNKNGKVLTHTKENYISPIKQERQKDQEFKAKTIRLVTLTT